MEGSSITYLVAAVLLIGANGFFVIAEFALVSLRRTKIDEMIGLGSRSAARVKGILDQLDAYLSTCQVGITLASLALGWIGEITFAHLFQQLFDWMQIFPAETPGTHAHFAAIIVAFVMITFLHVTVGEQAPKMLAIQFPESAAMWSALPLIAFHYTFLPLTFVLNKSTGIMLRSAGIKEAHPHARVHSEEELGMLLDESHRAGQISPDERRMLERVFKFHDKTVREIMVPRPDVVAMDLRAGKDEIIETAFESGFSRLPVFDGDLDKIIGIVYVKDLIYSLNHPKLIKLPDLLRPIIEVTDTSSISSLMREFQRRRIHLAVVVDEFGATTGLVTLEDVLEEIVGEIRDETDVEQEEFQRLPDGVTLVDCKASVDHFEEVFPELELPEGDYDTVGGLVIHLAGRLPREGETFRLDSYVMRVIKREGRRLRQVSVRKVPPGKTQQYKPLTEAALAEVRSLENAKIASVLPSHNHEPDDAVIKVIETTPTDDEPEMAALESVSRDSAEHDPAPSDEDRRRPA